MRIIAGRFRGTGLASPAGAAPDAHLRPTTDRVRESIFNLLAHGGYADPPPPQGRRVLDLFAGTGALGLEALSRGAARALFVEDYGKARALIRANIETLNVIGETRIYRRDATRLGPCRSEAFDLVFLDPPYRSGRGAAALRSAQAGGWLAPGALIVLELAIDEEPPQIAGFRTLDDRPYGDTRILILELIAS